jgi:hypothetical protein
MRSRLARTKPVTVTTFSDDRRNRQKNGSFKKFEDLMESWDWRDLLAGIDHVTSSGRRAVVSDAR